MTSAQEAISWGNARASAIRLDDEMPTAIRVVVDAFHGKLVGVHGELDPRQVAS